MPEAWGRLKTRLGRWARGPGVAGWGLPAAVAASSFATLAHVVSFDFTNLDDPLNFFGNPRIEALDWAHLKGMLTSFYFGVHEPLVWLGHALERHFWGANPAVVHLVNLLLHAATALAAYLLSLEVLRAARPRRAGEPESPWQWCSAFAALVFALHPLRVNVVAWASNRNYVQPGLFFFLSLWTYLKAQGAEERRGRLLWLGASLAAFECSLLSKAIGMTLPAVLVLLDATLLQRLGGDKGWRSRQARRAWLEKLPYALLALVAAAVAAKARAYAGALVPLSAFGVQERLASASYGLIWYLEKMLVPLRLSVMYPIPSHLHPLDSLCAPRTLAVLVLTALALWKRKTWPAFTAAWAYHVITLSPFLGITQYGVLLELTADKWFHLAAMGWAVFAGLGLLHAWLGAPGVPLARSQPRLALACALGLALLAGLSRRQAWMWRDSVTLYSRSIEVEPDCYHCRSNLSAILNGQARYDEVIRHCKEALRLKPGYYYASANLQLALNAQGLVSETLEMPASEMRRLWPGAAKSHLELATAAAARGRLLEAIELAGTAARLDPGSAEAPFLLGYFLSQLGHMDAALRSTARAVAIDPRHLNARINMGVFLFDKGLFRDAEPHFQEALRIYPGSSTAAYFLGLIREEKLRERRP